MKCTRIALFLLVAIIAACGSRAETAATAPASAATGSPAPTASPSPTPASSTPAPTPTPKPTTYTSLALAYRVDLPDPWRRSTCQSTVPGDDAVDAFTSARIDEESGGDTGPAQDVVVLQTEINRAGLTALAWLESGKLGLSTATHFEKATIDGKDGARVVPNDGSPSLAFAVAWRGRMYAMHAVLRSPAAQPAALAILASFHLFSDAELFDARLTAPTLKPIAPRSAQQVADVVTRGFAQKDVDLLATVMYDCVTTGAEQAGAGFRAAALYARDLRAQFSNGLVVSIAGQQVTPQNDRAEMLSTWTDSGQKPRNARIVLRRVGDTWYWDGVIFAL